MLFEDDVLPSFNYRMSGFSKVAIALKDRQNMFLQQDVLMLMLQFVKLPV